MPSGVLIEAATAVCSPGEYHCSRLGEIFANHQPLLVRGREDADRQLVIDGK